MVDSSYPILPRLMDNIFMIDTLLHVASPHVNEMLREAGLPV